MSATGARAGSAGDARAPIVFAVGVLAALALLWTLRELVMLVYASVLFAVVIQPLVETVAGLRIVRWTPSRGFALAAVAIGIVLATALIAMVLLPPLWGDVNGLIVQWPALSARGLAAIQQSSLLHRVDLSHLEVYFTQASGLALDLGRGVAAGVASLFTVMLLTIYLVVDGKSTFAWSLSLLPAGGRGRLAVTLRHAAQRMRGWLYAQAFIALVLGTSSACLFSLLHLRHALALALVAALLSFVPILGPIAAATLGAFAAAVDSWEKMAIVLAFFAVYQLFDNAYLTPRMMRGAVDIPGLAVILALAIGGTLGGILGAALAVPSAALAAELIREYVIKD